MFLGIGRFVLHVPAARNLKQRRQVVKSAKDRLRARLPVSVAEIGDPGRIQVATLGVAVVANEAARCDQILASVRSMLGGLPHAVLADVRTETQSFGGDGLGIRGGLGQDETWSAIDLESESWDDESGTDEGGPNG